MTTDKERKIGFTIDSVTKDTAHACVKRQVSGADWCWCCMELWPCRDAERMYTEALEAALVEAR